MRNVPLVSRRIQEEKERTAGNRRLLGPRVVESREQLIVLRLQIATEKTPLSKLACKASRDERKRHHATEARKRGAQLNHYQIVAPVFVNLQEIWNGWLFFRNVNLKCVQP
jgi:hypothetical protein